MDCSVSVYVQKLLRDLGHSLQFYQRDLLSKINQAHVIYMNDLLYTSVVVNDKKDDDADNLGEWEIV